MIIVKPNGGLGNRMRVINSCLALMHYKQQEKIKLSWNANSVLNASFADLFEPIAQVDLIRFHLPLLYCIASEKRGKSFALNNKIFSGHYYFNDETVEKLQFDEEHWQASGNDLIFNTCFDFYQPSKADNYYHLFKPVLKIQQNIERTCARFNGNSAIGVHIRRTDHVASKENSKTEIFIREMESMINAENSLHFYLSTDDESVEVEMRQHFGNKMISITNKTLSRNSKEGIADAVADMYCLSNTKTIIGSYQSSFSEVAAAIRNIPLIIAKQ